MGIHRRADPSGARTGHDGTGGAARGTAQSENGIKHSTWEMTRKRVTPDFFAAIRSMILLQP
jgi:hypothetical protein